MRAHSLLVIATSALFATTTLAIPSAGISQQQHQLSSDSRSDKRPAWRSVSNRIIKKICSLGNPDSPYLTDDRPRQLQNIPKPALNALQHGQDLVLRFNITSPAQANSLADAANILILDVWEYTDSWVDIRLAKDIIPSLLALLPSSLHHAHTPLMQELDLAQAIFDTYPSSSPRKAAHQVQPPRHHAFTPALHPATSSEDNIFFSDYQPLSVIQPWMRLMASLFTTHVRMINIGASYEGRDIPALRVGVHPTNNHQPSTKRKTVLITGGIHAREWISTSTVNYIAYSLIAAYGKNRQVTQLLEDFDWIFVPTVNPDGYVYTWEHDRLWRKNRQQTHLRFCRGVDLDRAFDFEWDGSSTKASPCSESFAGEGPFEGVEAKRLADWARNETENNNVEFVGLLDLHSYSQQILYPYSYSCDAAPPSLENLQELAAGLAKAIRLTGGHAYQAAPACEGNVAMTSNNDRHVFPRFESGGGSGLDWFYHELKVRYTYQIKLRDRGSYGFLLPRDHIVPTGKEILDAVLHFGTYLSDQLALTESHSGEDVTHNAPQTSSETEPVLIEQEAGDEDLAVDKVMWELRRSRRL